jgi:2,4-dienoyl-CoA reductase-like NADH-dependent reductase (Old Yellow Enzyme family)/thioredoxin reductase
MNDMFSQLFTPLRIGNMEIPNRIVMLPMTTGYCEADETVGDRLIHFYAERAKGGAGLIFIPFSPVTAGSPVEPGLFDDRFIPGVRRLTGAIRSKGSKVACQLITSYHMILRDNLTEAVAPSPIMNQMLRVIPRAVTVEEIRHIVGKYGEAARRVREGGFDALEVLVGGGYLLNRFLSPAGNRREDEYGGSLENRMRIILEILESMKKAVGEDFPIGIRLNIEEQMPGGHTVEDSKVVARILERAGVKFINAYTGWHESPVPTVASSLPKGAFAHLAEKVRNAVGIPVIAANRINDPFTAERILSAGQADLIGMGRALLADPMLPRKAKEGRTDEIVPCIACSNCLSGLLSTVYKNWGEGVNITCTVNPLLGREGEGLPVPADRPKKVFVAGGGPAGLTAAMTAAVRGHRVTLFEKKPESGGWLRVGCLPPHKEEIRNLANNMALRARQAGAEIRLNSVLDARTVAEGKCDALVLALGASPILPAIPGVNLPHVVPAEDVLTGRANVQGKVIVIGGGLVGCETAEFILDKSGNGTTVTVLEMLDRLASTISPTYRPFFLARLKKMGIRMETHTTVLEITGDGVKVDRKGSADFIPGSAVVVAVGLKPDPALAEGFQGLVREIYRIGDFVQPRMIKEAIAEGFEAGMKI